MPLFPYILKRLNIKHLAVHFVEDDLPVLQTEYD